MYKIIIWECHEEGANYISLFRYFELLRQFEIVGVYSDDAYYSYFQEYKLYSATEILKVEYDYIWICAGNAFLQAKAKLNSLGISDEKIIPAQVLNIPEFSMEKYVALKKAKLSIISNNCWGGILSHRLGLQFRSPFINMFIEDEDYLDLLCDLKQKLELPLEMYDTAYNENLGIKYPIYDLVGSKIHMNHYSNFKEAEIKWQQRIERINWDNILVMMQTENEECAKRFEELPYRKKVCFVPFESDLPHAVYFPNPGYEIPFWALITQCAQGYFRAYDTFELLKE